MQWHSIGEPSALAIDPDRLRDALAAAARQPGVAGWVAGSGFEGSPSLLDAGGDRLPLLGMGATAVSSLRDARGFFATLDRLHLDHPTVAFEPPPDPEGWIAKRAGGCGGWHILMATEPTCVHEDTYYQRLAGGVPMSALFLADGTHARLLGLNRLIVQPHGERPFLYGGAIGPIANAALQERIEQALRALVPAYTLRGLASLDFIEAQDTPWLLEINPRPSASMLLYPDACLVGLINAHLAALQGRLPDRAPQHNHVRGHRIVYAPQACRIDAACLSHLPYCHDLPAGAMRFAQGEPVGSVSAEAADAAEVEALLQARCAAVAASLMVATVR